MDIIASGVYGDENMPSIESFKHKTIGIWTSPDIDLTSVYNKMNTIKSCIVNCNMELLENITINIFSSV
ncbi:MAG: hypothetical protein ACOCRK_07120, partial [bacterium]